MRRETDQEMRKEREHNKDSEVLNGNAMTHVFAGFVCLAVIIVFSQTQRWKTDLLH